MKLGIMNQALPTALANADHVLVYAHNLGWDVAGTFESINSKTGIFSNLDAMVKCIADIARPHDHILIMSNGGFGGVHEKILRALAMKSMHVAA